MNGKNLIQKPLEPYFWKPLNDVQQYNGYKERLGIWKDAAALRKVKDYAICESDSSASVSFDMDLRFGKRKPAPEICHRPVGCRIRIGFI